MLHQLLSPTHRTETAELLSTKLELLLLCVRLVGSEDVSVGSKASNVLVALAKRGEVGSVVMSSQLVDEMRLIMQKNETVRFRVYDIAANFASASAENLSRCDEAQILQSLLDEVSSGDVLILLNGVELLKTLATSSHGRSFLEKQGMIQKLASSFVHLTDNPIGGLIVPGMMKFFGVIAHHDPGIVDRYPSVVDTLFNLIEDSDPSLRTVAIETFSFIASNSEAKLALNRNGNYLKSSS